MDQLRKPIPALKVRQWLAEWEEIDWSHENGSEPQKCFYIFSMPAKLLLALSATYARTTDRTTGADDKGIQRILDKKRAQEIEEFIRFGYPWSDLTDAKRRSGEFSDLRQPGWLPTAIVINILTESDSRKGVAISPRDIVLIDGSSDAHAEVNLPEGFDGPDWRHSSIPPFEVIDGQHRLWAFENSDLDGDFELPVVAFIGLDLRWQAYLFYTINIKPKKINASLAFDLYPLLRTQDWLTKFEGHAIYRETRSQELVDLLWSHPSSPWYHRINMLGETGLKGRVVTQAAWIRSLLTSFVKSWEAPKVKIGGLYGTAVGEHSTVLPWTRTEQAAFLILIGQETQRAIQSCQEEWAMALRSETADRTPDMFLDSNMELDPAFHGKHTLLNQDQGIRIFLQVMNDLFFVKADVLHLAEWGGGVSDGLPELDQVSMALESLGDERPLVDYARSIANALASYDWRSSDSDGLPEAVRVQKASFRGSGGYKELRRHVLQHLATRDGVVADAANAVINALKY